MTKKFRDKINYDDLKFVFDLAQEVCDPIAYISRRDKLLTAIGNYLLERDKMEEEEPEEEDE